MASAFQALKAAQDLVATDVIANLNGSDAGGHHEAQATVAHLFVPLQAVQNRIGGEIGPGGGQSSALDQSALALGVVCLLYTSPSPRD